MRLHIESNMFFFRHGASQLFFIFVSPTSAHEPCRLQLQGSTRPRCAPTAGASPDMASRSKSLSSWRSSRHLPKCQQLPLAEHKATASGLEVGGEINPELAGWLAYIGLEH